MRWSRRRRRDEGVGELEAGEVGLGVAERRRVGSVGSDGVFSLLGWLDGSAPRLGGMRNAGLVPLLHRPGDIWELGTRREFCGFWIVTGEINDWFRDGCCIIAGLTH